MDLLSASQRFDRALRFHALLQLHGIEFSNIPELHAMEEMSVLAAIAGLRRAALLVNMEASQVARLRDLAISFGLPTAPLRRRFVGGGIEWPHEFAKAFRQELAMSANQPGLWICGSTAMRALIRAEAESIGILLDYPACCVEEDERSNQQVRRAFEQAIVHRAGGDAVVLRRALREDWRVELPPTINLRLRGHHIGDSLSTFQFIFHVACSKCLADPESSSSAVLNSRYQAFVTELGDALGGIRELLTEGATV
jgi:hypothetical protein